MHYREVLRSQPDQSRAHHRLGLTLRALGRRHEAEAAFAQAIAYAPGSAAAHLDFGRLSPSQAVQPTHAPTSSARWPCRRSRLMRITIWVA